MSPSANSVIVVGGGIIGCACAAALSRQGMHVTLIEAGIIGGGATAAGMGHLVVMDDNPAELALTSYSLALWRKLVAKHAAGHEYHACGTIWVATDEEEMVAAKLKQENLRAHGIACQMLDAQALAKAEPGLRSGLAGGLKVAGDALVYPPKSAQLLLDLALGYGAKLVQGEVSALVPGGVRLADGSAYLASEVVIANGIAAATLLPELPLRYKKGHLLITDRYPDFIHHQLVELGYIKSAHASDGDSVAFNLQARPTGQIMIGSSRQFDVRDKAVESAMLARMLDNALQFVPGLNELKALRSWTGFRAASPDGLPLIGQHPEHPHVWLATGHEGLGITTALATAELLTNQICGLSSQIDTVPYLPSRFDLSIQPTT
ncbi:NAD(P)/FAD-dependent oxidoreductase [Undibacterium parvum]|uniref:FAD-binding oxidoreductase n=1 Tax=Undibacterium parvum TaxID=401471 RepID=A0A3S9HH92_9BURK|nr:FAD-binding oxidoreductase [Undibacterium parvum]AZP11485.1 FAD-binding oxidoreductase [Undibacterium parvum]